MKTDEEQRIKDLIGELGGRWKVTHKSQYDGRRQTVALIKIKDKYYQATAQCSKHDQFDKGLGRVIALGRAFKLYESGEDIPLKSINNDWRFNEDREGD